MSASRPDSRFTASCAARRCSSRLGTCSASSCSRASAISSASLRRRLPATLSASMRAASGACRPCRSPASRSRRPLSWRDCSSTLRLSGRQHLDLLLHLRHQRTLLVAGRLRGAHGVLEGRQLQRLLLGLRRQHGGLFLAGHDLRGDLLQLGAGRRLAIGPLRVLRLQLGQPRLGALAAFDDIADALLEPAHFQRRFAELALPGVQHVVGRVVRLAHRLQFGLHRAQLGQPRFQRIRGLGHRDLHALFLAGRVAVLQEPQLVQLERALVLQRAVPRRHLGLLLELVQVGVELAQDVVDARQVLARVLEPVLGLAAALLVLADAGGLFQEQAQLLGARFDDAADRALADDGVGARPQAGAQEDVLHVAPAHRLAVDVVAAAAVAREHAPHGDLGVAVPLPAGARQRVVEHQLHAGAAGRLAAGRSR